MGQIYQFSLGWNYCRHWWEDLRAGRGVQDINVDTGSSCIAKSEPRHLWVKCAKASTKRHFLEFAGLWEDGDTWPPFESELSLSYLTEYALITPPPCSQEGLVYHDQLYKTALMRKTLIYLFENSIALLALWFFSMLVIQEHGSCTSSFGMGMTNGLSR